VNYQESKYKPGNQTTLTGGLDIFNSKTIWRNDITIQMFSEETENKQEIYKSGTYLQWSSSLGKIWARYSFISSLRLSSRLNNSFLGANSTLIEENTNSNTLRVFTGNSLSRKFTKKINGLFSLDINGRDHNDYNSKDPRFKPYSVSWSYGPGMSYRLNKKTLCYVKLKRADGLVLSHFMTRYIEDRVGAWEITLSVSGRFK